MDALTSFSFLTDKLPSWITEVDDLKIYSSQKHKEFAAEFTKHDKARSPRSKPNSIKSLRHDDGEQILGRSTQSAPEIIPSQYTSFDLAADQAFATARRKRRTTPRSVRSGGSGRQGFSVKDSVVVSYDSHVQEAFESLVRNIAGARNNLRKGKMSNLMKTGFQLPQLRSRIPQPDILTADLGIPNGMRLKLSMSVIKPSTTPLPVDDSTESAFDRADKELEGAQSLCETAAHKFLRDGDCYVELEGIKRRFAATLTIGKLQREKLEEERLKEGRDQVEALLNGKDSLLNEKIPEVMAPKPIHHATVDPTAIEVDDEDSTESMELDISTFRAVRLGLRARVPVA